MGWKAYPMESDMLGAQSDSDGKGESASVVIFWVLNQDSQLVWPDYPSIYGSQGP